FEYEIPKADAIEIIARFSIEPIITKTRHEVPYEGALWHVDVFEGANAGLVVAEIELEHEAEVIVMPPWAGEEGTYDPPFGNSHLARFPFVTWKDVQRVAQQGAVPAAVASRVKAIHYDTPQERLSVIHAEYDNHGRGSRRYQARCHLSTLLRR